MKALITGINGQSGSYLAELLLSKGYEVHGLVRRSSSHNTARIDHIIDQIHIHQGDLTDSISLFDAFYAAQPEEVYNLAAQSLVSTSFRAPEYTADVDAVGTLRMLEMCKNFGRPKFYQASTSELFGKVRETPQNENTPFYPRSPYGVAKLYGYWATVNYRESYGMFACNGILFNHESPRRSEEFVTQKIVKAAVRIKKGLQETLELGNLDAKRDWGYAPDFVRAMWMMLQHVQPNDYVIATGETHTVREFLEEAFTYLGIDWRDYVVINSKFFRPAEVNLLLGDASKAKRVLGWEPQVKFKELVKIMVEAELSNEPI